MTLSEAIVVRMSHDLAGAVGAFANTVDLMKMDASFIGESVGLLEASSCQLMARLAFFRALFGVETKSIDVNLVQQYLNTLAIPVQFKGELNSRVQLALIAVGLELLGAGGTLTLEGQNLTIAGKELHKDPVFVQALMGTDVPCDPKIVMAIWLAYLAKDLDLKIHLEAKDEKIILSLL